MNSSAPDPKTAALLKRYSLHPAPESVARLAKLVAQRVDQNTDQIAKVVDADPALKTRLLAIASPSDDDPIDDVEQAIFRCGVEAVLGLAMADPLLRAVGRTFDDLLGIKLEQTDEDSIPSPSVAGYVATVAFIGRAEGKVFVRMGEPLGRKIAAKLLGSDPAQLTEAEIIDAVGELGNTIVGSFKSNLCDAGLSCKLSVPSVGPGGEFRLPATRRGGCQTFGFRCEGLPLLINMIVETSE